MNSRQFHQAGMKKCQAGKEEMQCKRQCRDQEFRYGIAKISLGLQKFRNGSENFAILAKFRYGQIFAMIAKITVHSEIQIFSMPSIFAMMAKFHYIAKVTVHSENSNFRYA